jgi:hypothetical protein
VNLFAMRRNLVEECARKLNLAQGAAGFLHPKPCAFSQGLIMQDDDGGSIVLLDPDDFETDRTGVTVVPCLPSIVWIAPTVLYL